MLDLLKLSPAPWRTENWDHVTWAWLRSAAGQTDLEFIALARLAFDVMLRRQWWVELEDDGWRIEWNHDLAVRGKCLAFPWWDYQKQTGQRARWGNPFVALVEANAWYVQHVEGKTS